MPSFSVSNIQYNNIVAFTCWRNLLTQLLLHFYIVIAVPAPEMPRVTPFYTSAEVTVSKPSGLCEGLRSSQITYEFKVYRSNSLVTTENVTTSGPTATATLSGLNRSTEYRAELRGVINVISQWIPVAVTFMTLGGKYVCMYIRVWYVVWADQVKSVLIFDLIYTQFPHCCTCMRVNSVMYCNTFVQLLIPMTFYILHGDDNALCQIKVM